MSDETDYKQLELPADQAALVVLWLICDKLGITQEEIRQCIKMFKESQYLKRNIP